MQMYITDEMLRAGLLSTGSLRLRVAGKSMAPLLRPGDEIWVEQVAPAALVCGDIVVMWREGGLLTHRLLAVHGSDCYTKGDSCRRMDPVAGTEMIVGKVVAAQRGSKHIDFRCQRWIIFNRLRGSLSLVEERIRRYGTQARRR